MTDSHSQPDTSDDPVTLLRGWAKAYRETPEYRFPSDPDAEFFPVDLEAAANEIERLRGRDSTWLGLSASEKACYYWPEDTDLHRQCRAAYIAGATDYALPSTEGNTRG